MQISQEEIREIELGIMPSSVFELRLRLAVAR
jgi:hypothetical protein